MPNSGGGATKLFADTNRMEKLATGLDDYSMRLSGTIAKVLPYSPYVAAGLASQADTLATMANLIRLVCIGLQTDGNMPKIGMFMLITGLQNGSINPTDPVLDTITKTYPDSPRGIGSGGTPPYAAPSGTHWESTHSHAEKATTIVWKLYPGEVEHQGFSIVDALLAGPKGLGEALVESLQRSFGSPPVGPGANPLGLPDNVARTLYVAEPLLTEINKQTGLGELLDDDLSTADIFAFVQYVAFLSTVSSVAGGLMAESGESAILALLKSLAKPGTSAKVLEDAAETIILAEAKASASSAVQKLRLEAQLVADEIANGHAFEKHVIGDANFPGVTTPEEFAAVIEKSWLRASVETVARDGRTWRFDIDTQTVIVRNPSHGIGVAESTAYRPVDLLHFQGELVKKGVSKLEVDQIWGDGTWASIQDLIKKGEL